MSRRTFWIWGAAAVAVVLVVGLVWWVRAGSGSGERLTPAGREIRKAGVSVVVPEAWPKNALQCGTPVADTYVLDPGKVPTCALSPEPKVSYVALRESDLSADPANSAATTAGQIGGVDVRTTEGSLPDGRTRWLAVVPDRDIVVEVVSADPALVETISGSVQID
ncbi:hypothetical protein DFJ67_0930 [Asanoa ferruginea]|uniref:Uncharacterized protein n=1 Tax=Asanoa ferruginea TaxID=53367 RepID=A0A3D9ZGI1_9ACTN|nr:hypothetical protein [Asanoa ferruginea]REF94983.1 hypothetical protein DFJ67_0930 [Asanoa ferruginea]GIF48795.1 hypothetical protein Afe04nite_33340 [Asanoa ferruginea]